MTTFKCPRGAEAYRRIEAESRSPMELVLMLYDGALRFVGEARDAMARQDVRARADAISRAMAIIAELQNTLNVGDGGAIARELDRLYTYMSSRLLEATAKQDAAALDDVRAVLVTLRDGWAQLATIAPGAAKP
ncbi:MAG: flagellar export chaperone FliS [Acidobacteria bacterium]|nr:flagellar export chaperone FliS [Acidobacteriota bacterium]